MTHIIEPIFQPFCNEFSVVVNKEQVNVESFWNEDDKKKVLFDKKEKNIFASALSMDEFFCVSNWKIAKVIRDTLKVIHGNIVRAKKIQIKTL